MSTTATPVSPATVKTKSVRGRTKRYYAMRFVPSWVAMYTYLGFKDGVDVPPPQFKHSPTYPEEITPGHGVAVVKSPILAVYPFFVIDAIVLILLLSITLTAGIQSMWAIGLIVILGLAIMTWVAYILWVCTAIVITLDAVTHFTRFYSTKTRSVQGADIGTIDVSNPDPNWLFNVLAKRFDFAIVEIGFGDTSGTQASLDSGRFMLRGIGNGEAVRALLIELQQSWEASLKEAAATAAQALKVQQQILTNLVELGEIGRQSLSLLSRIADRLAPVAPDITSGDATIPLPTVSFSSEQTPPDDTPTEII